MLDQQIPVPGWRGGDGDASYLDKTLRHETMELLLDESVAGRTVLRLWARASVIASAWFVFFLFLWLLSGGTDTGGGLLTVADFGSFVLFWLVFLMTRLQEPIGEWKVLLADRSAAKPDVYSQIHGRLRDRRLPIAFTARRIRTGLGRDSVGDRVVLVDGHYTAYISVFEYGTSLYLGWMMWRTRRGATLVGRFVGDVAGGMFGHTDPVKLMLRTERPRAMREAVHSVCREGLHVAIEGLSVPESYGFPGGLPPIEEAELTAAVPPPSVPPPAAMAMPESMASIAGVATSGAGTTATGTYEGAAYDGQYQQGFQQPAYDQPAYSQQPYSQQPYQDYSGQYQQFGAKDLLSATPISQQPEQLQELQQPQEPGFFHRGQAPAPSQDPYGTGYQQQPDQQQWGDGR
jgi:hypothetical protein